MVFAGQLPTVPRVASLNSPRLHASRGYVRQKVDRSGAGYATAKYGVSIRA